VASVLGALTNNGLGIAGVDWSARIQPVRVSGRCGALLSDTVDGMRWAGGLSVPGVPNNPRRRG
jgi:serine protease